METGFILDRYYGGAGPVWWIPGVPQKRWFGGLKLDQAYRVKTWRCKSCGWLASYAVPGMQVNQKAE
jgi:hypothetical protein